MITPGKGTLLKYESATPGTYTNILQRLTIDGPGQANGEKDDTSLDSECKKTSASLLDPGSLSFQAQYDGAAADCTKMETLLHSGAIINWEMIFNDASVETARTKTIFPGWVKSFKPSGFEIESNVVYDCEIRITGIPVTTPRS